MPEEPGTPLSPELMMPRLRTLWFMNTYAVPGDRTSGWTMPAEPPASFSGPPPPEYLPPYPNPSYWPATGESTSGGTTWPTWLQFWENSVPTWPPQFPVLPPFPWEPVVGIGNLPSSGFEELCCVGFNPEESMLEAIITISQSWGYGGGVCSAGSAESVGFWLIEPSRTIMPGAIPPGWGGAPAGPPYPAGKRKFIGEASVQVYDIPRVIAGPVGRLRYAVRLPLSPEMAQFITNCSAGAQAPILHCVLGWNMSVTDANFNSAGIFWGSVMETDIQFPKKSRLGKWSFIPRGADETNVFPIHAVQLKNRKVLFFSGSGYIYPAPATPPDAVGIFDPDTNLLQKLKEPDHDIFCAGHSVLPDGRVLVLGGTEIYKDDPGNHGIHHPHYPGLKDVSIFDPADNSWKEDPDVPEMHGGRWYPSSVVLGSGKVFVMDGHPEESDADRHGNYDLEIYDPVDNSWQFDANRNACTAVESDPGLYPRLHLLRDGRVFCSSTIRNLPDPDAQDPLNRIADNSTRCWNPANNLWDKITGGVADYDLHESSVLLPLTPPNYDPTVMIINKQDSLTCKPLADTETGRAWTSNGRGLARRRINGNAVLLPDGTVVLIGGVDDPVYPQAARDTFAIREVEIFDPNAVGQKWTVGAPLRNPRNYHTVAVLLYDGRVLVAGSNQNAALGGPQNFNRDLSMEIYSPDYLMRGPRPAFTVDTETVGYGGQLMIRLQEGWNWNYLNPNRIALMRCHSVTHNFGFDQRYVGVQGIPSANGREITVTIPTNTNVLPPGPYMLFLVSAAGAPSVARFVTIR